MYHLSRSGLALLVARRRQRGMRKLPQRIEHPAANAARIINTVFLTSLTADMGRILNEVNREPIEIDGRGTLQ